MSQLHPFKDSFDERKVLILDGLEGRKEIDYSYNGHKYEIVHIYSSSAQSFFKKDGEELNPNGGVKTCEELIRKELQITRDYFKIGKIGSNTKSFVDYTTSDRKNYIGTFLNIEDILLNYKIANKKLKSLKDDIDSVSTDLKRYKDEETIDTDINATEANIAALEDNLAKLLSEQGSLQTEIARDTEELGSQTVSSLEARKKEKEADIETNQTIRDSLKPIIESVEDLDKAKEDLSVEISELQGDIKRDTALIASKNLLITDAKNKLSGLKIELSALGNPEDIVKLNQEIAEVKEEIDTLQKKIVQNPMGIIIHNLQKDKQDPVRLLTKFTDFVRFIEKYYTELQRKSVTGSGSTIAAFFADDVEAIYDRLITASRHALSTKKELLASQEKELTTKQAHVCQLDNLKKRPKECNIDSCPFIKDAYEHRNVLSEIVAKQEEINQTKNDIETLEINAENLQNSYNLYQLFLTAYENLSVRQNQFFTVFVKDKSLVEWVNHSVSEFQKETQTVIDNVNDAMADISRFVQLKTLLMTKENAKKTIEDSGSTLREKYENDIQVIEAELAKLQTEFDDLTAANQKIAANVSEKQSLLENYQTYSLASSKLASAASMLSTITTTLDKVRDITARKIASEARLKVVNAEIDRLTQIKNAKTQELTTLAVAKESIKILKEKLKKLTDEFNPTKDVVSALSPTTGIPLILIKMYLAETEKITNDLLDVAFNGDFQIKFVTTDKDFSIRVFAKDNVKADIKLASQGELALTTISISLALIEQSIGDYNILCLDEIDGPLDSTNRESFTSILDSQINKLGIEQLFIISHNNAFDIAPVDLILLRDSNVDTSNANYMSNKNIIYSYGG